MNIIEQALMHIRDGVLPVKRDLFTSEVMAIREIAEAQAIKAGSLEGNLVYFAIATAYDVGFWMGWNHCKAEQIEVNDEPEQDEFETLAGFDIEKIQAIKELIEAVKGCTDEEVSRLIEILNTINKEG